MNARVLPEPDRFAVCPSEGRVLAFYKGAFESVYVLLHPFLKPALMSKDEFESEPYPHRTRILACCRPASWSEMKRLCGFPSLGDIDVALRTQILGLKEEFCNSANASKLRQIAEAEGIIEPSEGTFSDLSHNIILCFIQKKGYRWVWVGDEFGTERKLSLDRRSQEYRLGLNTRALQCVHSGPQILWTTHWDSHFSFFCGTTETIAELAKEASLEGLACDENTEVYWSVR